MLPTHFRLTRSAEISSVVRRGRVLRGRVSMLRVLRRRGEQRFAFVVSTKVSKLATVRNRVKRQARALVAQYQQRFPKDAHYLLSIRPLPSVPTRKQLLDDLFSYLASLQTAPR